ncbi:MAG: hypothetical protein AAB355_02580 [Patescibacteria group bacterium]
MKFNLPNLTIFLLFFGLALIEAIQKENWLEAAIFLILGIMFLRADLLKK